MCACGVEGDKIIIKYADYFMCVTHTVTTKKVGLFSIVRCVSVNSSRTVPVKSLMYIIVFFCDFFSFFLSLIINFKLACIKRCIGEHSFSSYFSPTSIIKICKLNIGVFDLEQTISLSLLFLLQLCIDDSCSLIVVSCYRYIFLNVYVCALFFQNGNLFRTMQT